MKAEDRRVREWLKSATKTQFLEVVEEALLTPQQIKFLKLHFYYGLAYIDIADSYNRSEIYVKRAVASAYRKIGGVIF